MGIYFFGPESVGIYFFNYKFPGDNFFFAFDPSPLPPFSFLMVHPLCNIDFTVAYLNNTRKLGVSKIGSFR